MGKGFEHGGLAPVEVWRLCDREGVLAIVEVASGILEGIDRPKGGAFSERDCFGVVLGK